VHARVALAADHLVLVVLAREDLQGRLDDAAAQAQHKMQRRLLLDVIVGQGAAVLELLAGKDEALLVRGDALLVLDLGLDVLDRVGRLDLLWFGWFGGGRPRVSACARFVGGERVASSAAVGAAAASVARRSRCLFLTSSVIVLPVRVLTKICMSGPSCLRQDSAGRHLCCVCLVCLREERERRE
jgi:hypothetical protein